MDSIRPGMQVLGSDGGVIGTVRGIEGDQMIVSSVGEGAEGHHHVPRGWVARVDEHVHLDRAAALVRDRWTAHGEPSAGARSRAPREKRKLSWLPWAALALLVLIALYALVRGLVYAADEPAYERAVAEGPGS